MTTIQISIELNAKLYRLQKEVEDILGVTISFDELLKSFFFLRDQSNLNMKLSKNEQIGKGSITFQVAMLYASGYSFSQIFKRIGLHQQAVKREIQKALKWFCKHQEYVSEQKKG